MSFKIYISLNSKVYRQFSIVQHIFRTCSQLANNMQEITDNITSSDKKVEDNESSSTVIREGKAEIVVSSENKIFYNPVQEFNRDLSVAALSAFSEEFHNKLKHIDNECKNKSDIMEKDRQDTTSDTGGKCKYGINILEAFSASGLRSIRYAKEVPGVNCVTANDISDQAIESMKNNITHNKVEELVNISHDDASMVMYKHRHFKERFDAVDLDPYGSPAQFLDAAVQSVKDGGILLVTCTDMAVLCGNAPETCHAKYGSISLKTKNCHEIAVRILLRSIESHANRYSRYIVPLLSISADFYIRTFVKVYTSPAVCKQSVSKLSWIYQCVGCEVFTLQPLGVITNEADEPRNVRVKITNGPPVSQKCQYCGSKHHIGGPIWSAPIHDIEFVKGVQSLVDSRKFGTAKRMTGMLTVISEELLDVPLYYSLDRLAGILHCSCMSMSTIRSAILNAGYRVSYSHMSRTSVKTDAPPDILWDIFRVWIEKNPVKPESMTSVSSAILSKKPSVEINLDYHEDALPLSKQKKLSRYPANPLPYWGPGTRATVCTDNEQITLKKMRNQGKKKRLREGNTEDNSQKLLKTDE